MSNADLEYDGQILTWKRKHQTYKATSGALLYQKPAEQCTKDVGPVPEGTYKLRLARSGTAKDDGTLRCHLMAGSGIQTIPRSPAVVCGDYYAAWGINRVRIEAADNATKQACGGSRDFFYLHDSTKGYSHGCIEVEGTFFKSLRAEADKHIRRHLLLRVKYVAGRSTYGGTRL